MTLSTDNLYDASAIGKYVVLAPTTAAIASMNTGGVSLLDTHAATLRRVANWVNSMDAQALRTLAIAAVQTSYSMIETAHLPYEPRLPMDVEPHHGFVNDVLQLMPSKWPRSGEATDSYSLGREYVAVVTAAAKAGTLGNPGLLLRRFARADNILGPLINLSHSELLEFISGAAREVEILITRLGDLGSSNPAAASPTTRQRGE